MMSAASNIAGASQRYAEMELLSLVASWTHPGLDKIACDMKGSSNATIDTNTSCVNAHHIFFDEPANIAKSQKGPTLKSGERCHCLARKQAPSSAVRHWACMPPRKAVAGRRGWQLSISAPLSAPRSGVNAGQKTAV